MTSVKTKIVIFLIIAGAIAYTWHIYEELVVDDNPNVHTHNYTIIERIQLQKEMAEVNKNIDWELANELVKRPEEIQHLKEYRSSIPDGILELTGAEISSKNGPLYAVTENGSVSITTSWYGHDTGLELTFILDENMDLKDVTIYAGNIPPDQELVKAGEYDGTAFLNGDNFSHYIREYTYASFDTEEEMNEYKNNTWK